MLMSTRHEIFSQNLARIRKQKGLTQADLSKRSGISRRAIVHYENHVAQPPLEKIETLSKALGVNIATLLVQRPCNFFLFAEKLNDVNSHQRADRRGPHLGEQEEITWSKH